MNLPRPLAGIILWMAFLTTLAVGEPPPNPLPAYQAEKAARTAELNRVYDGLLKKIGEAERTDQLPSTEAETFREAIARDRAGAARDADPPAPAKPLTAEEAETHRKRRKEFLDPATSAKGAAERTNEQAVTKMQGEVVSYAKALWETITTVEEYAGLREVVRAAAAERQPRNGRVPDSASILREIERILTAMVTYRQAVGDRDVLGTRTGLAQLGAERQPSGQGIGRTAIDEWRARERKEVLKRLLAMRTPELDQLFVSRGPPEKLLKHADEIEFHLTLEKLLNEAYFPFASFGISKWVTALEEVEMKFARSWAQLLSEVDGDNLAAAAETAAKLDLPLRGYSVAALAAVNNELAKLAQAVARQKEEGVAALDRRAREGLAKVDNAAAATALADALRAERAGAPAGPAASESELLETKLRELAQHMSNELENPRELLIQEPGMRTTKSGWPAQLQAVRERLYRQWFCRRAETPELMQAPLAELSLRKAIETRAAALHREANWTKLLRLLTTQQGLTDGARLRSDGEDLQGLKTFLTAQNLEKAELYAEAAQAYRRVLGCIGDYVPIEAAADRLRALRKDHPEALERLSAQSEQPP
jgi:hypothetical protein